MFALWRVRLSVGLVALAVAIALENVFLALRFRTHLAGSFEVAASFSQAGPFAMLLAVPVALVLASVGLAHGRTRRWLPALLGAALASVVAYGAAGGRLLVAYRPALALLFGGLVAGLLWVGEPWVRGRSRRDQVALGLAVAIGAWFADRWVLPRLYPSLHHGLCCLAVIAWVWAATAIAMHPGGHSTAGPQARPQVARWTSALGTALLALSLVGAWRGAPKLARADNLRLLLLDELPLLGRGVRLAAWLHPPDADEAPLDAPPLDAPGATGEPLHWQGTSLLLITVDALRADHVGAYGYTRPTTPNIDALAKRGARFDAAYCATPHTSYSVTSTMTGKYMRPLLHAGLGADSETLAEVLRRYGYRTAAFYPPAVFFIDEDRFQRFRDRHLGFEYAKIEFAKPALRVTQVEQYLAQAPPDVPLFLWVHIFEPHEPYEAHPEHDFGPAPKDLYDGEIATADQLIGDLVARFEAKRPGAALWVSADHGEEFGEHGGRYHGTSVYDEQVRVPLVVVGPGVPAASVIRSPVSLVDVAPTLLAALNIPRAPKMSGVDLAPLLRARDGQHAPGAWSGPGYWPPVLSETEEKSMVADGEHRLICDKATGACRLHHIPTDPTQQQEARDEGGRTRSRMKGLMQAIHRRHGALEGAEWPEALRRGMAGEADAAAEIAALLDDVRVDVRRQAARTLFRLRATDSEAALVRCKERDADDEVRAWCLLGLVRAHGHALDPAAAWLHVPAGSAGARAELAGYAALAMAERGDRRAEEGLAQFLSRADDFRDVREGLAAAGKLQGRRLTPPVIARLEDVRYRVQAAQVLGALNDPAARPALLARFRNERYLHARAAEANALASLGATDELYEPMAAYAGMPEPFEGALALAQTMPWFGPKVWAWRGGGARPDVLRFGAHRTEGVRSAEAWQVLVAGDCAALGLRETGEAPTTPGGWGSTQPLAAVRHGVGEAAVSVFRSRPRAAKPALSGGALSLELDLSGCAAPRAVWVVPAVQELPPPPPATEPDAGAP